MIMNINRVAFKVVVYPVEVRTLNSNGKGLFHEFVDDTKVKMIDVEAVEFNTGRGREAATLPTGEGMVQGDMGCLLQDKNCPSIAACGVLLKMRCSCFGNLLHADLVYSLSYINRISMFSLPRPPEISNLEDKVKFKG
ncbi:hypothetical protein QQ045_010994 [Rhodiola kirilowii]